MGKKMKSPIFYFIGIWLLYLFGYLLLKATEPSISGVLFGAVIILDAIAAWYAFWLWKNAIDKAKRIFGFFAIAFLAIFIADLVYQPLYNFFHASLIKTSVLLLSAYSIPYIIFLLFQFLALGEIFPRIHLYKNRLSNIVLYVPVLIIITVLSVMFFLTFQSARHAFAPDRLYRVIEVVLQLGSFVMAVLCLVIAKNKGVVCLSLGFAINMLADLIMNMNIFAQSYAMGSVVETNCIFVLLLWIYGLVYFKNSGTYKQQPIEWTHVNDSVKIQTSL
jgi:hypothetical protein